MKIETHEDRIEVMFRNTITHTIVTSDHFDELGYETECLFNTLIIYRPTHLDEDSFLTAVISVLLDLTERRVIGRII